MGEGGGSMQIESILAPRPLLSGAAPPPEGGARRHRDPTEEQRLLAACAYGDGEALSQLYDRFGGMLFAQILRIVGNSGDAQDVLQEVFLYAWNRAARYDPRRASVSTWLVLIARSRAIDRLRKLQNVDRILARVETEKEWRPAYPQGPTAVLNAERRQLVRAALQDLPRGQRRVLELAYYGGLTQAEIAQEMCIPLGTVKTRTLAAMRKLRAALAPEISQLI
jgi:RNA polymerase sigma-70 factor (ECF subfamily)